MVDDEQVVAHLLHLGEDVGAEDHGVLPGQGADQGADLQDLLGVQAHGGLIQNEHLWEAQQGLGQAHPLAVALGQVAQQPPPHTGDAGELHHPGGLLPPVPFGHLFQLGGELQILLRRHIQVEGRQLGQIADGPLGRLRLPDHAVPVHQDLPLCGAQIAGHQVHGGGLSRPVGAQKAEDLAVGHGKGQVVHRRMAAVPLNQVAYFDHRTRPPCIQWPLYPTPKS